MARAANTYRNNVRSISFQQGKHRRIQLATQRAQAEFQETIATKTAAVVEPVVEPVVESAVSLNEEQAVAEPVTKGKRASKKTTVVEAGLEEGQEVATKPAPRKRASKKTEEVLAA